MTIKCKNHYPDNEGTKVQNPRHLCHVHCIVNIHVHIYTRQYYAYADKCVSVRELRVYGNLAKTKALRSSSSLLPTLRGISGTAWPTVCLLSSFRNFRPWKSERRFAAVPPNATLVNTTCRSSNRRHNSIHDVQSGLKSDRLLSEPPVSTYWCNARYSKRAKTGRER